MYEFKTIEYSNYKNHRALLCNLMEKSLSLNSFDRQQLPTKPSELSLTPTNSLSLSLSSTVEEQSNMETDFSS